MFLINPGYVFLKYKNKWIQQYGVKLKKYMLPQH